MLKKEVEINGLYRAKVSGRLVIVRITSKCTNPLSGRTYWEAVNQTTGKTIRIKSAAKLRRPVIASSSLGALDAFGDL